MIVWSYIRISGKAGQAFLEEFGTRGTKITALARIPSKVPASPNLTVVKGDVSTDDLVPIISGAKTVICVIGSPVDPANPYSMCNDEGGAVWVDWMKKIIQASKDAKVGRFILMGGAGKCPNSQA